MLVFTGLAWAYPTPEQLQEIQGLIDQGSEARNRDQDLLKQLDTETDPSKRKDLINRWFNANRTWRARRQRAIELTDLYFEIDTTNATGEPQFDDWLVAEGDTDAGGRVRIGERAFRSPQVLATTKIHELEHSYQVVDEHRRPDDKKKDCMMEIEAYDQELKMVASKTHLPPDEIAKVVARRQSYFDQLSAANQALVNATNYRSDAVLLKDALDYQWVKAEFTGRGVAAGDIMEVRFTPLLDRPLRLEISLGTVLKPNRKDVQTMMVCSDVFVPLLRDPVSLSLPGYCLDPAKQPPPKEAPADLAWSIEEPCDSERYPAAAGVIRAGNQLSQANQFHTDLPPEKYRETVIQRALWQQADPTWDKARLQSDLCKQVEASGGKQTPEQVQQLTNHLWQDVDLTLKTGQKSRL